MTKASVLLDAMLVVDVAVLLAVVMTAAVLAAVLPAIASYSYDESCCTCAHCCCAHGWPC